LLQTGNKANKIARLR